MESLTPDQSRCHQLLVELVGGEHHLPRVAYPTPRSAEVSLPACTLSTFDSDRLTTLVLLAHRDLIRVSLGNGGPRCVKVTLHAREAEGRLFQRHLSLKDLSTQIERMVHE